MSNDDGGDDDDENNTTSCARHGELSPGQTFIFLRSFSDYYGTNGCARSGSTREKLRRWNDQRGQPSTARAQADRNGDPDDPIARTCGQASGRMSPRTSQAPKRDSPPRARGRGLSSLMLLLLILSGFLFQSNRKQQTTPFRTRAGVSVRAYS